MERKIGSTFTDNGVELRVELAEIEGYCFGCHYNNTTCSDAEMLKIRGNCALQDRADEIDVIFTEVTKTE